MGTVVAILVGGAGRRIGGDKPRRLLAGARLLDHALTRVNDTAAPCIMVARSPQQVEGFAGTVVLDEPGIDGPLAGLLSALNWAAETGADRVLTLPCDMPFLPADLLARLEQALAPDVDVALAASDGRLHPICALWRTAVVPALVQRASEGQLSLRGLAEAVGCVAVDWPVEEGDPFININTAEDLAAAEAALR